VRSGIECRAVSHFRVNDSIPGLALPSVCADKLSNFATFKDEPCRLSVFNSSRNRPDPTVSFNLIRGASVRCRGDPAPRTRSLAEPRAAGLVAATGSDLTGWMFGDGGDTAGGSRNLSGNRLARFVLGPSSSILMGRSPQQRIRNLFCIYLVCTVALIESASRKKYLSPDPESWCKRQVCSKA
jgi:hypothetical protein